ncbi:MAG: hypothetical protein ABIJ26_01960 [Candidatus Margulisiibacteriota bacterium]
MKNKKTIYFSLACDVDPDIDSIDASKEYWWGIANGIPLLRKALRIPMTWLLRADRMITEVYSDPAYCFKRFQKLWEEETKTFKSEIGWHPHLFRFDGTNSKWLPYLGKGDDLGTLSASLDALRQHADVVSVRTGWEYQSNSLMKLFDQKGILVEASATPGSLQAGAWSHDWRGTPRMPYHPSRNDYRRPAASREDALKLVEIPMLARRLSPLLRTARFAIRAKRRIFDWPSSAWQGAIITKDPRCFDQAVEQTIREGSRVIAAYCHCSEFLEPENLKNIMVNMESLFSFADHLGYSVTTTTLAGLGSLLRSSDTELIKCA